MNATVLPAPATNAGAKVDLDALADRIAEVAASLDAATHQLLTYLRAFDELNGWAIQGAVSCAHWLSWQCGIGLGAAREKVRVAHALGGLPRIDDQLRRGQLSFSKVRAMIRVATPANEARLVDLAVHATASQLEKTCRLLDQTAPETPDDDRRWLRTRDVPGGMVRIEVQLRPEEAARIIAACDSLAASRRERPDALVTMAEATLRGDRPDRPPVEVQVHIDAATLTGHVETGGLGVSAETSRRLLCDAAIVPIIEDAEGRPLDVRRKTRVFAGALRRALVARDGGCRFPGCTHTRYVDAHHLHHWVDGGETSLANGILLCTRHHRLVHEGGFTVAIEDGVVRFRDRRRREVVVAPPAARPAPLPATAERAPVWRGDPIDYDLALSAPGMMNHT